MSLKALNVAGTVVASKPGARLVNLAMNTVTSYFALSRLSSVKGIELSDRTTLLKFISLYIGLKIYQSSISKDPLGGKRYQPEIAAACEAWRRDYLAQFPISLECVGPKLKALAAARAANPDPAAHQNYIIATHPHGALCAFSAFQHMITGHGLDAAIPRSERRVLGAEFFSYTPFLRELTGGFGAVSASRESALKCLEQNLSLEIFPGGEREMLLTKEGEDAVYVGHKGFVKLALEHGTPLIPAYAFGEVDLVHTSELMLEQRLWLSKKTQLAVPLVYGDSWVNPLKPMYKPVTIVVGDPIELDCCPNPPQAVVDYYHGIFVQALIDLFDGNKERLGYGDRELVVRGEWQNPSDALKVGAKL